MFHGFLSLQQPSLRIRLSLLEALAYERLQGRKRRRNLRINPTVSRHQPFVENPSLPRRHPFALSPEGQIRIVPDRLPCIAHQGSGGEPPKHPVWRVWLYILGQSQRDRHPECRSFMVGRWKDHGWQDRRGRWERLYPIPCNVRNKQVYRRSSYQVLKFSDSNHCTIGEEATISCSYWFRESAACAVLCYRSAGSVVCESGQGHEP